VLRHHHPDRVAPKRYATRQDLSPENSDSERRRPHGVSGTLGWPVYDNPVFYALSGPLGSETAAWTWLLQFREDAQLRITLFRAVCAVFVNVGLAQSPANQPTFEAASVKRSDPTATELAPNTCQGGPGTSDPGLFTCTNAALNVLVIRAYGLQFYQLISPDWMNQGGSQSGYNIAAKLPEGTTPDRFRLMFQNLLSERFHLVVHREARDLPRYSLMLGKDKPKIKRSSEPAPPGPAFAQTIVIGHLRFSQHNRPLASFAGFLTTQLSTAVVDETGLSGDYDITIEFMPDSRWRGIGSLPPVNSATDDTPNLFVAIQNQLGLKLESRKGPVEVVVVDHADKTPVAN
jgi:uncharacterized protein (TIGR03435 family)